MKRNPRPVLIGLSVINLVALIVVLAYQLNGLAQLAPLRDALTGLLAALLAGVIALYTVDYLNEQNQSREWERKVLDWNGKELLKALEPIYDEIVGNRDSSRELVAGSKVAWNRLMKGSRRERVPVFLWPELTSYYDKVEAQQDVYFQTWKSVKTSVDTT